MKSNGVNDLLIQEALLPGSIKSKVSTAHIRAEFERMGKVIREANIVLD